MYIKSCIYIEMRGALPPQPVTHVMIIKHRNDLSFISTLSAYFL